jgi:hypothetical protein
MPRTKQHWQVENPQTTSKQHDGSNSLNRKLRVRTDGMDIVVDAEQENYCPGYKNRQENPQERGPKRVRGNADWPTTQPQC